MTETEQTPETGAPEPKTAHLTCIICPMGCQLEVTLPEGYTAQSARTTDPALFAVSGNACPRGDSYARKELTAPERTLTCTVAVSGGSRPLVSAKTDGEVPKEKLLACMQEVRRLTVAAPVHAKDVLISDILHTGVDLIACEDIA